MERLLARRWTGFALIAACVLLVFLNTFGNAFHYDDEHSILENPHLRSLKNIPRFFSDPGAFSGLPEARMYRPLLLVTYALNYAVGGYAVFGYHLVNLFLHLLAAFLIYALARTLQAHPLAALLAALFFAVHPLVSEPVNYLSSRSSLLVALFFLSGFFLLVEAAARRPTLKAAALIALCHLAALGAKETAFVFPLIGGIYLLWRPAPRPWRLLLVPVLLDLVYALGTRAIIGKAMLAPVRPHSAQLATQTKAMVFYAWKVAMPVDLSVEPQFRVSHSVDLAVLSALLALGSIGWLLWRGWRRSRRLAFWGCWFAVALLPPSLVPLYVLVNEHRLYLPLAGLSLGMAELLAASRPLRRWWWPVLAILALLCAQRNPVWRTEESLWADAVAKGPQMARPYVNLGKAYLEQGRLEEAIEVTQRALELEPGLARAYYNLGTAHLRLGERELAVAYYRRALELQPDLIPAHNNLGNAYQEQGLYAQAIDAYRRALALQAHPSLYHNLGRAFLEQGEMDSAGAYFRQALALDPEMSEAYKGLAKACLRGGQPQTALEVLGEGLARGSREPDLWQLAAEAHAALGQEQEAIRAYQQAGKDSAEIWLQLGDQARRRQDWEHARQYYRQALEAGGEKAKVYGALGEVHRLQGQAGEALEAFRQAAQLDPGLVAPYLGIGRVYLAHGNPLEAIAALERAASLAPKDGMIRGLLAEAYRLGGKREQAIQAYRQAIALAPEQAEFYHNLGFLLAGHGEEAERLYRAALERDPELVEAWFNLGYLLLEQGRSLEAVRAYQQVLARQPQRAEAYLNLATAWLNLGQLEKAASAYQRFLEFYPRQDETRRRAAQQLEWLKAVVHPSR